MVKANNHEEVDESKFGEQLFEVLKNECQCDMWVSSKSVSVSLISATKV